MSGAVHLHAMGVTGIDEIHAGDDLAVVLLEAVQAMGEVLQPGDVVVVASKVVSKAMGLAFPAPSRDDAIAAQTVRVVAERSTPRGPARIVVSRAGPVMAAAGVDASNLPAGQVALLPEDPDQAARQLRAGLRALEAPPVAVVISDTAGRPWRQGQVDFALGCAGLVPWEDLRGQRDAHGNLLEVTVRAIADEVAAVADLVKGKLSGVPAAIVRGLADHVRDPDGPGAAPLIRQGAEDWFRFGHVEAVQAALGVPSDRSTLEPQPVGPRTLAQRLERAVAVASAGMAADWPGSDATLARPAADAVRVAATDPLHVGAMAQRVLTACWAEGLRAGAVRERDAVVVHVAEDAAR